jgi:hypothetical protein
MSLGTNVDAGKCWCGQLLMWASVDAGKCWCGQMLMQANVDEGKCWCGQMSMWTNVNVGKCWCRQMSMWEIFDASKGWCAQRSTVYKNDDKILPKIDSFFANDILPQGTRAQSFLTNVRQGLKCLPVTKMAYSGNTLCRLIHELFLLT